VFEEKVHKERETAGENLGKLEVYEEPEAKKSKKSKEDGESEEPDEESEDEDTGADIEDEDSGTPEESTESDETIKKPTEESPEEPAEQQPGPSDETTEASYNKFLKSEEADESKNKPKEVVFKKTDRPLITKSEEEIDKRAEEILHPSSVDETDNPHLAGIPEKDKAEAKELKEEPSVGKGEVHVDVNSEAEGVDLIESAQSKRKEPPKKPKNAKKTKK